MCRTQRGDSNSSYRLREGGSRRICSVWIGSEVKSYEQNKGNTDTSREISSTYTNRADKKNKLGQRKQKKKICMQIITNEYIYINVNTYMTTHASMCKCIHEIHT